MSTINTITAKDYCVMMAGGISYLGRNVDHVNNLNVFPVPDGDTGTNMLSTVKGACAATADENTSLDDYAVKAAGAMMRASRGNSGVILSLFFRGVAKVFAGHGTADTGLFLEALKQGAVSAASAVAQPVEGTILTVMRECCADCKAVEDVSEFLGEIIVRAEEVLAKTPEMLPALRHAKVVDSGGQGFVYILMGMKAALDGEVIESSENVDVPANDGEVSAAGAVDADIKFAFCTECLVDKEEGSPAEHKELREWLETMGDSIVYVEDDTMIKLHVHTNEPLTVLGRMAECGTFEKCKIENMKIQHSNIINEKPQEKPHEKEKKKDVVFKEKNAIVAVYDGQGMSDALSEAGVSRTVNGGKSMNPSTDDIIKAVRETSAQTVFVLPDNKNTILAARQAGEIVAEDKIDVRVIPTHSVPQGISAALAFNASRSADDNEKNMKEAASETVTISVAVAARDSESNGVSIKKNQYMGIVDGKICESEDNLEVLLEKVIGRFEDYGYFAVYYGSSVKKKEVQTIETAISSTVPEADVNMVYGGQKVYLLIISAEL